MNNICETNSLVNKEYAGDMRKAAFEQRRKDYVRSSHDRAAVFIEHPINDKQVNTKINE